MMDHKLRNLLDEHDHDAASQYTLAGLTNDTVKDFILGEMAIANERQDWKAWNTLLQMASIISDPAVKADTLNALLVMPGHQMHQAVTMEIQELGSASSVPFIRSVLEGGFGMLEYTSSDTETIAKWFSHALARIGTPEAIALIREFSESSDAGVAEEMRYRLERIQERDART